MKCGAFDSGLTIHPDGKTTPCCQFDIELAKNINEIDWKDPWKDLRNGEGCGACQGPGPVYKDAYNPYINKQFAVRWLDVRNNNLCNMECIICNSYYSSKWASRLGHDEKFVSTNIDVDLGNVRRIYFAGGEPFLNKQHWEILKNIKDPSQCDLIYSSNLTIIKGIEDHWPKFNHILVNASLDGVGEFGEQIRPGLNWQRWQNNLDQVLKYENVTVEIACTVNLANIWHLHEVKKFADEKNISVRFYKMDHPNYLCISSLPEELKKQIKYIPNDEIQELLNQNQEHLFKHAIANILLGDRLRGTNLWNHLPFEQWAIKNILDY